MTQWYDDEEDDDADDDDWSSAAASSTSPDDRDASDVAELPDPSDTDPPGDDAQTTILCPFCARAVYEFADVCPKCGNFIGSSDEPHARRPAWVVVGLALCLAGAIAGCFYRMW